jgi:hypothetical protein
LILLQDRAFGPPDLGRLFDFAMATLHGTTWF